MAATSRRLFPETSQTLVEAMRSQDEKVREVSVARFCITYYPSIYGFARMMGLSQVDAQDLVQDFCVKVVSEGLLKKYEPQRGSKFSSWLMTCFKHLVLNHLEAQRAKRRGGGIEFVELDSLHAESCHLSANSAGLDAEKAFDLTLARQLWRQTVSRLKQRHEGRASKQLAEALIPMLLPLRWPAPPSPTQAELAERCGVSTVNFKAFFNNTLKKQALRYFSEVASEVCPRIEEADIMHLWALVREAEHVEEIEHRR